MHGRLSSCSIHGHLPNADNSPNKNDLGEILRIFCNATCSRKPNLSKQKRSTSGDAPLNSRRRYTEATKRPSSSSFGIAPRIYTGALQFVTGKLPTHERFEDISPSRV